MFLDELFKFIEARLVLNEEMKESFLGETFKSLKLLTRVAGSRFLSNTSDSLMEYLHSDRDLIVKTFGQMKNPFSLISADDEKEKDKVPIIDTTSAPTNQDNVSTPIINNNDNSVETNGGGTLVTPNQSHQNN
eukprot:14199649-Ditylum_brightwellii.AAC.1